MTEEVPGQKIEQETAGNSGQVLGVNAGRDGIAVARDYVVNNNAPAAPAQVRTSQEQILLKAVRAEVRGRLKQSLHNEAIHINLGKESQPDQVRRPWDYDVKVGSRPIEALPSDQTVVDVFDREEIGGKLLILGEPGGGKTTTLLDLANTLVTRAEKSAAAIPVLFNLSSWKKDQQGIGDWLLGELCQKYTVSRELGQDWIDRQVLLPLLDGLDELEPQRQELCVQRINTWMSSGKGPGSLVVCSRVEEYGHYESELVLGGAICLQLLDDGQIESYLRAVNRPELRAAVATDRQLREMVRVPLQMSMAVLVYDEKFGADWRRQETEEARLSLLLEAYVTHRLKSTEVRGGYGKGKEPTAAQTRQWLSWLAQQLKAESRDEFLIEQMQPSLLVAARQEWIYRRIVWLIYGLIVWLIVWLIFGLIYGLIYGLIIGLMGGLIVGLDPIKPVESFELSFSCFVRKNFFLKLVEGLIIGLVVGLVVGLIGVLIVGLIGGLIIGLTGGLIGGLIVGLIFGLIGVLRQDIAVRTVANQGILNSRNNTILLTIAAIILAIKFSIFLKPFLAFWIGINLAVKVVAISQTMLIWYSFAETGGRACIKHFALRIVLHYSGVIPWNYARFLDYSTDRLLLQRVGGRYRFIHKRLQDHFAAMP